MFQPVRAYSFKEESLYRKEGISLSYRSDDFRGRRMRAGRMPAEPQRDVIVSALAMQILLCVLLLAAAGICRKADRPAFDRLKAGYEYMATDTGQTQRLAEITDGWMGGVNSLFSSAESWLMSLFARATGQEEIVQSEPPAPEQFASELPAEEAEGEDLSRAAGGFSYDYLRPAGAAGGWQPVSSAAQVMGQMAAPKGSTLAPVYLGGKIITPVEGLVTSKFAYRYHPVTETSDFHTGIDIAAEEGRAILAALPGEVVEVGESDIYGLYIVIQHATHLQTSYSHCSEIIAREGMAVRQGERIAKVGRTGMVTGPHVHFSVIVDGQYTDPLWVMEDNIRVVE